MRMPAEVVSDNCSRTAATRARLAANGSVNGFFSSAVYSSISPTVRLSINVSERHESSKYWAFYKPSEAERGEKQADFLQLVVLLGSTLQQFLWPIAFQWSVCTMALDNGFIMHCVATWASTHPLHVR